MDGLAKILEAQTKDKEPQVITGDWTNNISVSDMFSKDEVQKYYDIIKEPRVTPNLNWKKGWYSDFEAKEKKETEGYWHIPLGGSDKDREEFTIEQDWVQEIWDKINLDLKVLRVYLNGHYAGEPGDIHIDGWTPDQYTVLVYLNPNITSHHGGTIEFWTPNLTAEQQAYSMDTPYGPMGNSEPNIIRAYWPKPGRVVTFDARIPHVARGLHEASKHFRISLVFKASKTA